MGRYPSDDSGSPVRTRESGRKRSPPRREKSPARNKSSYKARSPVKEKPSSRTRSPEKSRLREKPSGRTRSPRRGKSRSPVSHSPVKDKPLSQSRSSRHTKSSYSPVRDKPSSRARSRSPVHHPPSRERTSNQTRSPKRPKSISPAARSPSPRTKRLRRAKDESESVIVNERAQKTDLRVSERSTHREKDSEEEEPRARRENKSGRNAIRNGSSRSKRGRSSSPSDHYQTRSRSRSPPNASERRDRDEVTISRRGEYNSRGGEHGNTDDDSVAKMAAAAEALEKKEKQKPSFELSGKLAEETNRFRGITLLFNEAPDARKPETRWRLYVFKGGDVLNEPLYVHRQTSYLFGRERRVADIPTDHPSCSKQHAVLQYRQVETEEPDGTLSKQVRPYIMDLGSTNGTFINEERIDPQRYYELREKDTIKFGNSSREYVLLHENSAG